MLVWPATTVPCSAGGTEKGRDGLAALYISSHLAVISVLINR